jgi:hypothetical protein
MFARNKAHMKKGQFQKRLIFACVRPSQASISHHESRNAVLLAKLSALSAAAGKLASCKQANSTLIVVTC